MRRGVDRGVEILTVGRGSKVTETRVELLGGGRVDGVGDAVPDDFEGGHVAGDRARCVRCRIDEELGRPQVEAGELDLGGGGRNGAADRN